MKPLALASLLAALAAPALHAADVPRTPLRPISECLRIDQINEWHIVDVRTLTVRTGPRRYLVKLTADCPRLGYRPGLFFRSSPSNQAVAPERICGEVGEAVFVPREQPPCAIQSVSLIDKNAFDAYTARASRHGNGAEQPTLAPPKP